jgi:hypothetical protein
LKIFFIFYKCLLVRPISKVNQFAQTWRTNENPIIAIKLLARGLDGLGAGAIHTSLLFETSIEYLTVEYGDGGRDARCYPQSKKVEAYTEIMVEQNHACYCI